MLATYTVFEFLVATLKKRKTGEVNFNIFNPNAQLIIISTCNPYDSY